MSDKSVLASRYHYVLLATVAACSQSGQPDGTGIQTQVSTGTSTSLVWTRMSGKEPPMKTEFSMVYDGDHQRLIAFGGRDANFNNVRETWSYDFETDTWTNRNPVVSPPWRAFHSMVFDSSQGTIIMFGGDDFNIAYNDLWEYDYQQNTWIELAPSRAPPARQMHGMAFDVENNVVILFGGRLTGGGAALRDTWEYSAVNNTWRSLEPAQSPPVQDHVKLGYDGAHGKTILFSGPRNHNPSSIGTWEYDSEANSWSQITTQISPTSDHGSFVYNRNSSQFVLIGNTLTSNDMETWVFDYSSAEWILMPSTDALSYREHFGFAYNDAHDAYILVGGYPNNENWLLHLEN